MKCGICDGQHLTIHCPRLSRNELKQASSADKQASAQPKAQFPESQPVTHALLTPVTHDTSVTHDTGQSVTHSVTHASANAARQARWRASHKAERARYMRSYRARKVPG